MKRVLSLIFFASMMPACGGSSGPADVTMISMANPTQFVANSLLVPMDRTTYGMDLNGDGKVDNQLGNIIGALTANNLDTQGGVDTAICEGQVVLLMTETSADATFQNDAASGTLVQVGKQWPYPSPAPATCAAGTGGPKYDGTDDFDLDTTFAGAQFDGRIVNGAFNSNSPVTTKSPVTVSLQLPLVAGAAPVQLTIVGAHIQFHYTGGKIMNGQINGAIRQKDVTDTIIPNVAALLNSRVVADPTSSTNKQILQIFDIGNGANGDCTNPDGTMSAPKDGMVGVCEVSGNSIIKNVLNPDVQMFDSAGNYHPNPANTTTICCRWASCWASASPRVKATFH